mmetsp:Transcript_557/g.1783  ORF Transcript_557/g.1783 Transcript_557/m.1783 type:complete len:355 (-) Transcript_557:1620-2684(-)
MRPQGVSIRPVPSHVDHGPRGRHSFNSLPISFTITFHRQASGGRLNRICDQPLLLDFLGWIHNAQESSKRAYADRLHVHKKCRQFNFMTRAFSRHCSPVLQAITNPWCCCWYPNACHAIIDTFKQGWQVCWLKDDWRWWRWRWSLCCLLLALLLRHLWLWRRRRRRLLLWRNYQLCEHCPLFLRCYNFGHWRGWWWLTIFIFSSRFLVRRWCLLLFLFCLLFFFLLFDCRLLSFSLPFLRIFTLLTSLHPCCPFSSSSFTGSFSCSSCFFCSLLGCSRLCRLLRFLLFQTICFQLLLSWNGPSQLATAFARDQGSRSSQQAANHCLDGRIVYQQSWHNSLQREFLLQAKIECCD